MPSTAMLNRNDDAVDNKLRHTLQEELVIEDSALDMKARAGEAEAVRRQIDYYFSDQNLMKDSFLLKQMKGHRNRPIPVKVISNFSKMREYQPLNFVVEALKTSSQVNIIKENGVDLLQRKEPFHKPKETTPATPWKKLTAASGFEEYYVEGPLTPEQAAEEAEIYDPDYTFEERIEAAVLRYIARRKFNSQQSHCFTHWMKFGGIDASPHALTGNTPDPSELEGLTNKERKQAVAPKPYVCGEEMDAQGNPLWMVDFETVAKAYLSSVVPDKFCFARSQQYVDLANVMQNFLQYLQLHRVCPEYNAAINAAKRICAQAARELPACDELQSSLPGAFNTTASTLAGGIFASAYVEDQPWAQGQSSKEFDHSHGLSGKNARQLFAAGVVTFEMLKPGGGGTVDTKQIFKQTISAREIAIALEIVETIPPDAVTRAYHKRIKVSEPLGQLICKPWTPPDFLTWDLPPSVSPSTPHKSDSYTFLLEESLLQLCHPGLKLENANVVTLRPSGIQILDGIPSHTRASFYTVLENELVMKWKEPRFITREEQKEREAFWEESKKAPEPMSEEERKKWEKESGGSGGASGEEGADDEFD